MDHDRLNLRIDPWPLLCDGLDTREYEPLLIPDRELRETPGAYPSRALVGGLKDTLALHALLAYVSLQALGKTRTATLDLLTGTGIGAIEPLLAKGRQRLALDTMAASEDELRVWCSQKYEVLRGRGFRLPEKLMSELVKAELSAVHLINIAYDRSREITRAFERVQRAELRRTARDDEAVRSFTKINHTWIEGAFARRDSGLDPGHLFELAVYSNINPAILWPQHIRHYTVFFEIGRFLGLVDRGVEARLAHEHLAVVQAILRDELGPFKDDRAFVVAMIKEKLMGHFPGRLLRDTIDDGMRHGADLFAARATRALSLRPGMAELAKTPPGHRGSIMAIIIAVAAWFWPGADKAHAGKQ